MRISPGSHIPLVPAPSRRPPARQSVTGAEATRPAARDGARPAQAAGDGRPAGERSTSQTARAGRELAGGLQSLRSRDREVRSHELAHQSIGGQYAGAASFDYVRGPDGRRYAVGGEVAIDVSPAATPEETLRKMAIVRRAALAPAEPSAQDYEVAAEAAAQAQAARAELARDGRSREGDYLERGRTAAAEDALAPAGVRAFRRVAALGEPEFLSVGGRVDLNA